MDILEHVNNILDQVSCVFVEKSKFSLFSPLFQLITSQTPQNEFNSIEYINKIFPNEQSLSNIDEVLKILKDKIG